MTTYQILTVVLSLLSILGLGTASSLFWKDAHDKKVQNSEKKKAEIKRERQEEIKSVLDETLAPIIEKQDKIDHSLQLIEDGTRCTLRDTLLKAYKSCSQQLYRTTEETQNWEKLYMAYHRLNGNSFIDDLKVQFEAIDTYEEFKAKEIRRNMKDGRK